MSTTKTENITLLPYRERVKLVRDRVASIRMPTVQNLKKPARVTAAEKVVREWDELNEAHRHAQRILHKQKLNAVTDALIMGDMAKAVALMQKLEA